MKDALWRRLLAGIIGVTLIIAGISLGAALGMGIAESVISGTNGFVTLIEEGRPSRGQVQIGHQIGLVFGMAIMGALTLHLIVVPTLRLTGLVSEKTLQRMTSQHRRP